MNKLLLCCCVLLFFWSCNDATEGQGEHTDTKAINPQEKASLEDDLLPVTEVFTQLDSSFNRGSFYESGIDTLDRKTPTPLDTTGISAFIPFLIYNEDSSMAIDPYSYNYVILQRGGQQKVSEGGPDVEVSLIDLRQKTKSRLWFGGPSSQLLDLQWKNKEELWISGTEEMDSAHYQPFVLSINTRDLTIQRWSSDELLQGEKKDLLKQRLQAKLNATRTNRAF